MQQEQINDIDGALWRLIEENGQIDCATTIYKFIEKTTPINEDLGSYRYHILTFKPNEPESTIEFMKAYIGDVRNFIDNYAKSGYSGLIVKDGCIPRKTVKDLIKWVLSTTSKTEAQIKKELKHWVKGYSVKDHKRASFTKA